MRKFFLVFFATNFLIIAETVELDSVDSYQLSSLISYKVLNDGRFEYSLSNKVFKPDISYKYVFGTEPENIDEVIFDSTKMAVIIRGRITLEELRKMFDGRTHWGMLPYYWDEFITREKKSGKYDSDLYQLIGIEGFNPPGALSSLHTFKISNNKMILISLTSGVLDKEHKFPKINYGLTYKKGQYKLKTLSKEKLELKDEQAYVDFNLDDLPLRLNNEETCLAKFNKHSPFCMCCSRYALRIFNSNNEYIWEDTLHVYGGISSLIFDFDEDGIDEIVMYREEHGICALLLLERKKD